MKSIMPKIDHAHPAAMNKELGITMLNEAYLISGPTLVDHVNK